uniref:P-selectin-like isoform X3 n=1 Tax=Styela clava TaxID=7725 RepID=UPI0019393C98|nr:P-selectin-like isoform X3 [Styela clava]
MKYRGVCLVLLFGFFTCPVIRAEHPCRVAGGIIRNKKCFWIILETLNAIQSEEKCSEFTSTPANIYDMNHFDSVIVYGRSLIPEGLNWYFVHLGMKFDPDNQLLKNYDESNSNLHATVWVASEPWSSASAPRTRTVIQFTNYPTFLSDGLRTFSGSTGIAKGVICETNELECLPLEIDGETQEMDCTDFSSTCTISCKPGFIYGDGSKSLTLTCQDSLEWDGEVPACQPAKCPELNFDGQPGLMHCTGNGYLDKCTFVCESLKKIKGPKTRTCMGDKTWSDIHPTCEDVVCQAIDFPADQGTFDCTDGNNYGSYCSFYCKSGLRRWGAKKVVCLWKGEWSEEPPTCKKYDPKCPAAHKHSSCPETNCAVNADCNDDKKICCPTKCGTSVCWDLPKRSISKEALFFILFGGMSGNPCPRNCLVNACQVTTCPANLNAQCRTTCNGCRAHFYDFRHEITSQCRCPRNYPPVPNCNQQDCANYRCVTYGQQISYYYASQFNNPNVQCRMSSCGGCLPQFYNLSGRRINCRQILQITSNPGIPVPNSPTAR